LTTPHLIIILFCIISHHVEESKLVHALACGDNPQPVSKLLLLQKLLGPAVNVSYLSINTLKASNLQILQIPPGEISVSYDLDLSVSDLRDLDNITKISRSAINLDFVVQELFESRDVEDLI
jgi:hypothetical protein